MPMYRVITKFGFSKFVFLYTEIKSPYRGKKGKAFSNGITFIRLIREEGREINGGLHSRKQAVLSAEFDCRS